MSTLTKTVIFSGDTFTDSKPTFTVVESFKGLKYSNISKLISGFTTDYGYISVTLTFNGTAPYAGVSFQSPPPVSSTFSVGVDGIDGLFFRFYDGISYGYDIQLTNGVSKTVLIIVNGDPNHLVDSLEVLGSVGVKHNVNPGNVNSLTITYTCQPTPLYKYHMGLHVYSPYDSINTPKLSTELSSKTPIASWITGTTVWSTAWFDFPSPQYYYGYSVNNKVYKVGGPIDRAYGTKKIYDIVTSTWRNLWHRPAKVHIKIEGPQYYYHSDDDTIDACVNVLLSKAGIITEVINKGIIPTPIKYKYWTGYNSSNKQNSNDNFFAKWVFGQEKFYPITGQFHMMYKLIGGYVESTNFDIGMGDSWAPLLASGLPLAATSILSNISAVVDALTIHSTFIPGGPFSKWIIHMLTKAPAFSSIPYAGWISLAILATMLIITLFKKKRQTLIEDCKIFLGEYDTTPYIETGTAISRLQDMSQKNLGYYCDGVYFYTQTGGTPSVTVKELSYTNALVNENPIQQQFMYSLACDDPTFVTEIHKLLLLPYTSGIPVDYTGGTIYYSVAITTGVTLSDCAELLSTPPSTTYILPSGYSISFISQADADRLAQEVMASINLLVVGTYHYGELLSEENLGVIDAYFTHEIRVETTPTITSIFYNNTDQLGPVVGRKVFFDEAGQYETMNGYYGTDDLIYFRVFYKVVNSVITNKYIMIASNSTTVQGLGGVEDTLPVNILNLTYSSNWYIQSPSQFTIVNIVNDILSNRCFDLNSLYGNPNIVRGYYDAANNHFLLYADNYNNYTTAQASADWYKPIIEWPFEEMFEYSPIIFIDINIEEICLPATIYNNALYGFYVIGSASGNVTPLFNQVNLTVAVYVNGVLKHTYTVITNESGKTYVPYGGFIADTDIITSIVIASINSSNPIGNISYTIGTFTNCINCPPINPFASGLIACWNFEEGSGTIFDSTANNNDLSPNGTILYHQTGKVGNYSIGLNGANSRLSGATSTLQIIGNMSISTWVKLTSLASSNQTIIGVGRTTPANFIGAYELALSVISAGGYTVLFWGINSSAPFASSEGMLLDPFQWHHIVFTLNGSTYVGNMYLDGVVSPLSPYNLGGAPNNYSNAYVSVGNRAIVLNDNPLLGDLDVLSVWNRELTACEVKTLYNDGNGIACS